MAFPFWGVQTWSIHNLGWWEERRWEKRSESDLWRFQFWKRGDIRHKTFLGTCVLQVSMARSLTFLYRLWLYSDLQWRNAIWPLAAQKLHISLRFGLWVWHIPSTLAESARPNGHGIVFFQAYMVQLYTSHHFSRYIAPSVKERPAGNADGFILRQMVRCVSSASKMHRIRGYIGSSIEPSNLRVTAEALINWNQDSPLKPPVFWVF